MPTGEMKAAVLHGKGDLRIQTLKIPEISDEEVLIRVKAASMCGTDIHFYKGELETKTPRVLGHDFSGVVAKVGGNVKGFNEGDRVISEIVRYCGECYHCSKGNHHLCANAKYIGFEVDGSFAEYTAAPARSVFKIPDNVSFDEAAMTEPLALALHVMDFIQPKLGETIAIFGQGPVGLVQTQVAKLSEMVVIVIETQPIRLKLSKELGADHTINPKEVDLRKSILKITHGLGVDCSVEAAGLQETIDQAFEVTRSGGKLVLVGAGKNLRGPPLRHSEVVIWAPSNGGVGKYPVALQLVSEGKVNLRKLVTHRIPLRMIPSIIEDLSANRLETIKVIVEP